MRVGIFRDRRVGVDQTSGRKGTIEEDLLVEVGVSRQIEYCWQRSNLASG